MLGVLFSAIHRIFHYVGIFARIEDNRKTVSPLGWISADKGDGLSAKDRG
jgi:hypothetical protein